MALAAITIPFTNGDEMCKLHPDTYTVPDMSEKAAANPGTHVKVGVAVNHPNVSSEKFWVRVTENDNVNQIITGQIDNDLVFTNSHGLKCDDVIKLPYYAILDTI